MAVENNNQRFKEVLYALLNQPLGVELIEILKDRLISNQHVFTPGSSPEQDKFYLGRHSVYKDMINISKTPPNKKEKVDE